MMPPATTSQDQRSREKVTVTDPDGQRSEARIVNEPQESFGRLYVDVLYIGSIGRNSFGWDYRTAGQPNWYSVGHDHQKALDAMWRAFLEAHCLCPETTECAMDGAS